jgi:hypothetical protein
MSGNRLLDYLDHMAKAETRVGHARHETPNLALSRRHGGRGKASESECCSPWPCGSVRDETFTETDKR